MQKILLDTNMYIYLLDNHILDQKIEKLTRMLFDSDEYKIVVHPKTIIEAQNIKQKELRDIFISKVKVYKQIDSPPIPTEEFIKMVGVNSNNDKIDCAMLYAVKQNCVQYFITNDKELKKKSCKIGLGDRVLTIDEALEKFEPPKKECIETPVFIKEEVLTNVEIADPFFDSLREDYYDFDNWLIRKQEQGKKAFIIKNKENKVTSFLMLKEEAADDNDLSLFKELPCVERLKVSTFKVGDNGKRIGETFIKLMIRAAQEKKSEIIYVTIFPKQEKLISVLAEYGFVFYTHKKTKNAKGEEVIENVYIKDMNDYNYYPNIKYTNQGVFFVPIRPEFNKLLFPESEINPQISLDDYDGLITSANAIKKAYICNSNIRKITRGDILIFYSTRDNKRLTAIGVVDVVYSNLKEIEEIKNIVRKRTAYTDEQLESFAEKNNLVILFKHYITFGKEITYQDLLNMGIVNGSIQQIQTTTIESLIKIISKDDTITKSINIHIE